MNSTAGPEAAFRRWLRCYPRWYRREHEDEMIAVLVAVAREGSQGPVVAQCWDLVRSAVKVRLRRRLARSQRSLWGALRLVYLAAVVQMAVGVTVLATMSRLHSALAAHDAAYTAAEWHAEVTGVVHPLALECGTGVVALLVLAWAYGRNQRWARLSAAGGLAGLLAITTDSLLTGLRHGSEVNARADVLAGLLLRLVEVAGLVVALHANRRPGAHHAYVTALRTGRVFLSGSPPPR